MHNLDTTEDFFQYRRVRGLSQHTLRAYRQDVRDFIHWRARTSNYAPVTKDAIRQWIEDLRERKLAPASIRRRLACIKVLYHWLESEGRIQENPLKALQTGIQLPKRLPRNLTDTEIHVLLSNSGHKLASTASPNQQTLMLAIELLFATAVRVGELCKIRLQDIDLTNGIITIEGKGNRERRVFIVDQSIQRLTKKYICQRREAARPTENLLITSRGTAATPDFIRKHLIRHTQSLHIPRRITPHMLRHTAATQLLENGLDIRHVQKLLGHASIATTEIYTHVSDQSLKEAIHLANPRRKF